MPRAAGDKRRERLPGRVRRGNEDTRPSSAARGYDHRWREFASLYRLRHPVCERCNQCGVTTPAQCVDHIVPHGGNRAAMYDVSNLQSLCYYCHNTKTGIENTYPVTWPQRDGVAVVSGLPGTGKSYYCNEHYGNVFDVDNEAVKRGMGSWPRLPSDTETLHRLREAWLQELDQSGRPASAAIIVTWPSEAHRIARRIRAAWIHLTCDPDARERRVMQRNRKRWHEAAPASGEHVQ